VPAVLREVREVNTMNITLKRVLVTVSSVAFSATALIGVLHTPFGKPLLSALKGLPGCPVNLENADPSLAEAFRSQQLAARVGSNAAQSRTALSFELGKTVRSEVDAWASQHQLACTSARKDSVLRCENVRVPENAPTINDLHLQFDAKQRLVAVDLFRSDGNPNVLLDHYKALGAKLEQRVGPMTAQSGSADSTYLAESYRRASQSFRYRDYVAELSVMNYGPRGVRVREQYQWLDRS
jgi:hypothetical protein